MFAWRDNYISYNGMAVSGNDPYWASVSLLLNYETPQTAFTDASTNNFAITTTGTPTTNLRTPFASGAGASMYFSGSANYLSMPANVAWNLGNGNWTFECWIYMTSVSAQGGYFPILTWGTGSFATFRIRSTGINFEGSPSFSTTANFPSTIVINTWYHVALVRSSSTTVTAYLNGVGGTPITTLTSSTTFGDSTNLMRIGYKSDPMYFYGFMSNWRLVKGTAVYTGNFTPSTSPLTAISGTSGLLNFTNQGQQTTSATVYNDQGPNTFAITSSGSPAWAGLTPFTNSYPGSIYFSGSSSTFLSTSANAAYAFGTGDFTVELWYYRTATSSAAAIAGTWTGTASTSAWLLTQGQSNTANIRWGSSDGTTTAFVESTPCIVNNTWGHIAISRGSGVLKMFYNGTQVYSAANTTNISNSSTALQIMAVASSFLSAGYVSNLRIVKGTAVYTAAFVSPTTPLTAITNTSFLLTGNTGSLYDLSTQGNQLTAAQTTQTSVYKYGTQSGLTTTGITTVTDATNLQFATGNFTIEGWIYRNASGAVGGIISKGSSTTGWRVRVNASNQLVFATSAADVKTSTTTIAATTWTYFAWTRSGSTNYMFINGTLEGSSFTDSTNFNQTNNLLVGSDGVNTTLQGYMDEVRLTKGVSRYTASFTAPTSQFPTGAASVDYLIVGGGGGGGGYTGGGGGAGGVRTGTSTNIAAGAYSVVVGTGGAGGTAGNQGTNGTFSSFNSISGAGGGGGGSNNNGGGGNKAPGLAGGSGGGSSNDGIAVGAVGAGNTPFTSPSQGNNGGLVYTPWGGGGTGVYATGGGGGASAVGGAATSTKGGDGGAGVSSSISGTAVTYGGGGGGGIFKTSGTTDIGGAGGSGGGGKGYGGSTTGQGATSGTPNTGGGGGGQGQNLGTIAGSGGSGIVIISYLTDGSNGISSSSTGGTKTTSGAYTIHTFTTSGTFTVVLS